MHSDNVSQYIFCLAFKNETAHLHVEGKPSAMNPKRIAELEKEGFVWEIRSGAGSTKKAPRGSTGGAPQAAARAPVTAAEAAAAASATLAAHGHGRASIALPAPGAIPHPVHHAAAAAAAATGGVLPMPRPMPPVVGMMPPTRMAAIGIPPPLPSAGVPPPLPVGYASVAGAVRPAIPVGVPPPAAAAAPVAAAPPPVNPATASASAVNSNTDKKVEASSEAGATSTVSI